MSSAVPESVYLVESLTRVNMSHNCIKELSSLSGSSTSLSLSLSLFSSPYHSLPPFSPDTWLNLVTLDLSHNMITALHVSTHTVQYTTHIFLGTVIPVSLTPLSPPISLSLTSHSAAQHLQVLKTEEAVSKWLVYYTIIHHCKRDAP